MKLFITLLTMIGMMGYTMESEAKDNAELLAIHIIAKYEGFQPTAYTCPGGKQTIGYGFTDEKLIALGTITRKRADYELGKIVRKELAFVNARLAHLTERQKAAVVSFIFNFGRTKFLGSTYYKKLKANDIAGAKAELLKWTNVKKLVNGKIVVTELGGLVKRRTAEAKWLIMG